MRSLHFQKGMTLIELMIAGVLGLVITYFVMNIMISSNRTTLTSEGQAQSQENGRFVMSWLQEEARRAGYSPFSASTPVTPFAELCASGAAVPPATDGNCSYESTTGWGDNDRLAIHWNYNPDATADRDQQDCTGVAITLTDTTELVDVYWVESDDSDSGFDDVLRCVTYNDETGSILSSAQSIASGVIGMQLLYGESMDDTTDDTTNVSRYVNGSEVTDWDRIQAVKISVLTRAFGEASLQQQDRSYILLDADPYNFSDRISRYIQTSTIALPNRQ